jgi:hypothetical protein
MGGPTVFNLYSPAWNDSMYRNRSIATRLANSSLLPEARVL